MKSFQIQGSNSGRDHSKQRIIKIPNSLLFLLLINDYSVLYLDFSNKILLLPISGVLVKIFSVGITFFHPQQPTPQAGYDSRQGNQGQRMVF
jgi:hypothetical protein